MGVWEIKHEAKLVEWQEKVMECRSSGMSVREWCEEQGIERRTYYRWEKEILAKASRKMRERKREEGPTFVEVVVAKEEPQPTKEERWGVAARLHTGEWELDIYSGADRETVRIVIEVLRDVE